MNSIKKWLNREVTWGILIKLIICINIIVLGFCIVLAKSSDLKDMERQKYIKNLDLKTKKGFNKHRKVNEVIKCVPDRV